LGRYLDEDGVTLRLRRALHSLSPRVACSAAAALARHGRGETVERLVKRFLRSPNPCFRINGVAGAARLRIAGTGSRLRYLADRDPRMDVRRAAMRAVWRVTRNTAHRRSLFFGARRGRTGKRHFAAWLRRKEWSAERGAQVLATRMLDGQDAVSDPNASQNEFVAIWVRNTLTKERSLPFRVMLPTGWTFWSATDRFGYAAFDEVRRGRVDIEVQEPAKKKKAARPPKPRKTKQKPPRSR
jgi:hypothetical protein